MTKDQQSFRLGQRVCRVNWRDGQPYLEFGTITKATATTYYVDGSKKRSLGWDTDARRAIDAEYRFLFGQWGLLTSAPIPDGWTLKDTVRCVLRLRRMERRLLIRRRKNR